VKNRKLIPVLICLGLTLALVLSACGSSTVTSTTTPNTSITTTPGATTSAGSALKSIEATTDMIGLVAKATQQIYINATLADGTTSTVTSKCTYKSDNEKVATVTAGGLVTGVGQGAANITVSYAVGGVTQTTVIYVDVM
jgi:hypothetical protein